MRVCKQASEQARGEWRTMEESLKNRLEGKGGRGKTKRLCRLPGRKRERERERSFIDYQEVTEGR